MTTDSGYLVLADISGYTSYLAGVELDHAHEVLTDLLEHIVGSFKSLLTISKLEGDAVFAYVPEANLVRGETLFELVETTYAVFRDRVEAIRRRTTCTCNACRAIPTLDLKFILHYGQYMVQSIAGIHELVGSDVNLVHRLLKNHVGEATRWRAYALFTSVALDRLGLPCDRALLYVGSEAYEHLGEVETYSLNLAERYRAMVEARRVIVSPEEADLKVEANYRISPAALWDMLNDPQQRSRIYAGTTWLAGERPGGRTAAGARNHCAHGKGESSTETVLDWRPFEYYTTDNTSGPNTGFKMTFRFDPVEAGAATRLTITGVMYAKGLPKVATRLMARAMLRPTMQKALGQITRLLAAGTAPGAAAEREQVHSTA